MDKHTHTHTYSEYIRTHTHIHSGKCNTHARAHTKNTRGIGERGGRGNPHDTPKKRQESTPTNHAKKNHTKKTNKACQPKHTYQTNFVLVAGRLHKVALSFPLPFSLSLSLSVGDQPLSPTGNASRTGEQNTHPACLLAVRGDDGGRSLSLSLCLLCPHSPAASLSIVFLWDAGVTCVESQKCPRMHAKHSMCVCVCVRVCRFVCVCECVCAAPLPPPPHPTWDCSAPLLVAAAAALCTMHTASPLSVCVCVCVCVHMRYAQLSSQKEKKWRQHTTHIHQPCCVSVGVLTRRPFALHMLCF